MDWCKTSGRLVTCSQDRNAFVWTFNSESGEWDKQMVVLRFNRAATFCTWSPDGSKFAVASGAKVVAVCAFDSTNDWWYATHIPKFKSTVTSLAWHPNSVLLAAGGCDYHCRVAAVSPRAAACGASAPARAARADAPPPPPLVSLAGLDRRDRRHAVHRPFRLR